MSSTLFLDVVRVVRSFVYCVDHCSFYLILLAIVLAVLLFTDSDYTFGIFKLFLSLYITWRLIRYLICDLVHVKHVIFTFLFCYGTTRGKIFCNKMKMKTYHTLRRVSKSNRKNGRPRGQFDISNTCLHVHNRSLSLFCAGTPLKVAELN
jgi:hypothetical protein